MDADPITLVCQKLGQLNNRTNDSLSHCNDSTRPYDTATYVVSINSTECSVREACEQESNEMTTDSCHGTVSEIVPPERSHTCSKGDLYAVIAFLVFTNILLMVCVSLCGIALCSVKTKKVARYMQ